MAGRRPHCHFAGERTKTRIFIEKEGGRSCFDNQDLLVRRVTISRKILGENDYCWSFSSLLLPSQTWLWALPAHGVALLFCDFRLIAMDPDESVLMVEGLTLTVRDQHLVEIFGNYGLVVDATVERDKRRKLSKGFGYVTFATRDEAEQAQLHLNGAQIDGNTVNTNLVLFNRRRHSSQPEGRGRSFSPRRASRDRGASPRSTHSHSPAKYRRDRAHSRSRSRSRSRSWSRPRMRSRGIDQQTYGRRRNDRSSSRSYDGSSSRSRSFEHE